MTQQLQNKIDEIVNDLSERLGQFEQAVFAALNRAYDVGRAEGADEAVRKIVEQIGGSLPGSVGVQAQDQEKKIVLRDVILYVLSKYPTGLTPTQIWREARKDGHKFAESSLSSALSRMNGTDVYRDGDRWVSLRKNKTDVVALVTGEKYVSSRRRVTAPRGTVKNAVVSVVNSLPPTGATATEIREAVLRINPKINRNSVSPALCNLRDDGVLRLVGDFWVPVDDGSTRQGVQDESAFS